MTQATPTIYDETLEAWKQETHTPELQPLRPGLYNDIAAYFRRIREAQRNLDQKSLKATILEEEQRRLQQLTQQLVDKRLEKLRRHAVKGEGGPVEQSEKWLLDALTEITRQTQHFKEDITQGREPTMIPQKKKASLILRFIKEVPSIIGVDLKTHGPFLKEDIATLPYENAEGLIRQGAAVEVRASIQENG